MCGKLGAAESSAGRRLIHQGCTGGSSMAADLQSYFTLAGVGRGSGKQRKMLKILVLNCLVFNLPWQ